MTSEIVQMSGIVRVYRSSTTFDRFARDVIGWSRAIGCECLIYSGTGFRFLCIGASRGHDSLESLMPSWDRSDETVYHD
jgi:hypothetical protein